jgi:hypothetical protein
MHPEYTVMMGLTLLVIAAGINLGYILLRPERPDDPLRIWPGMVVAILLGLGIWLALLWSIL